MKKEERKFNSNHLKKKSIISEDFEKNLSKDSKKDFKIEKKNFFFDSINKPERIILYVVLISIVIILILFVLVFTKYMTTPEVKAGFGGNIESAVLDPTGEAVYIKLSGGNNNLNNLESIKFVFIDKDGKEYDYTTTKGIKHLSMPYKKNMFEWLMGINKYKGFYDYKIELKDIKGLDNFKDIKEIKVLFKFKNKDNKEKEIIVDKKPIAPKKKVETKNKPSLRTSSSSSGGGSSSPTCTPSKTCADYPGQCGKELSDGCNNVLDCSNNCLDDQYCYTGEGDVTNICINEGISCTDTDGKDYSKSGKVILESSFTWNGGSGGGFGESFDQCLDEKNLSEPYCYWNGTLFIPKSENVSCEDKCFGGACVVSCTEDSNCDSFDSECSESSCDSDNYYCVNTPKAQGTECTGGTCDANGNCVENNACTINSDCDDDNECTTDTCDSGSCVNTPKAEGTECTEGTCDANGNCVGSTFISYYTFENSENGIIQDQQGNNDGTLIGNAHIVDDAEKGKVLSILNKGDYVNSGDINEIDGTNTFTFSTWIKLDTNSLDKDVDIFNKGGSHSLDLPLLIWRDESSNSGDQEGNTNCLSVLVSDGTNSKIISSQTDSLNDNKWHHIAVSFNSGTTDGLKIYIDGTLDQTGDTTNLNNVEPSDSDLIIGSDSETSDYSGEYIDDVRIYNSELTANGILGIYNTEKSKFNEICDDGEDNDNDGNIDCDDEDCSQNSACQQTSTFISYYTFENSENGIIQDQQGNNDGTLIGNAHIVDDAEKGKVLYLDGSGDYVNCGNDDSLNFPVNHPFTLSYWVKAEEDSYQSFMAPIIKSHFSNSYGNLIESSTGNLNIYTNGDFDSDFKVTGYFTGFWNKWIYVAQTYDENGKICVYKNGELNGCSDEGKSLEVSTENLLIGAQHDGGYSFKGYIDDVRIYNSGLTANGILGIYNTEKPLCIPECSGKECGEDGCGGSCGSCQSGEVCNTQQQCIIQECSSDSDCSCPEDTCSDINDDGSSDYLDYPSYGSCNDYTCNIGTGSGESCEPMVTYGDTQYCGNVNTLSFMSKIYKFFKRIFGFS